MKNMKNTIRSIVAAGTIGLASIVQTATAQTNQPIISNLSGDLTYFAAQEADSGAPTTYAEINHSAKLPYGIGTFGFIDLYGEGNGYFGKTVVEKSLTEKLSLRGHALHINEPFSQAGFGLSYVLPTPKKVFAKLSYLPLWIDSEGKKVEDNQILGYFASVDLPHNLSLFSFGEINPVAAKGPQWSYGEIELAKNFGKKFSIGANIQLNCKEPGKLEPEVVPRLAARIKF